MSTEDFQLSYEYPVDAQTLYRQFATQKGVRHWWTAHCTMDERLGGRAHFPFADAGFFATATISELEPDRLVAWTVTDSKHPDSCRWTDLHDWIGTTIRFRIEPIDERRSNLTFTHEGLAPLECAETCSSIWRTYLGQSLMNFLRSGTGDPYRDKKAMSGQNKEIIHRLYGEVMGNGNLEVAEEIFDADYVDHMPIMATPDLAGLLRSVEATRLAFPDVKPRIIAEISEGDWVAIAVAVDSGPQKGVYMGIEPKGRSVTWTETHFWRVQDGKIKEHYGNVSLFEIHKMLGSHDLPDKLC